MSVIGISRQLFVVGRAATAASNSLLALANSLSAASTPDQQLVYRRPTVLTCVLAPASCGLLDSLMAEGHESTPVSEVSDTPPKDRPIDDGKTGLHRAVTSPTNSNVTCRTSAVLNVLWQLRRTRA